MNKRLSSLATEVRESVPVRAGALSISQITLTNYRNYDGLRLSPQAGPVVLAGSNGSGKTNLLEAISLLVPGRGLRRCSLSALQNRQTPDPWAVAIELQTDAGLLRIGTGRDNAVNDSEGERRLVHIDGRPMRSQSLLAEHIAMAWITPDMDSLLSEGPSARRKFLDRLACSFDPSHGTRVLAYEKAMRERLRLLREGGADALWLSALENEMAQSAVAIASSRRHLVTRLCAAIAKGDDVFPRAELAVCGAAEDMLETMPALLVEDSLRTAFAASRTADAQHGTCATGAHRSDLRVVHAAKKCPADICSSGEQKALMIALMLAYVRLLSEQRRMKPLFLLDDIAAHLDDMRREALFEEVLALGVQAWFSGTDAKTFASLSCCAQIFSVENGTIA
ncbi:MAG: DNA replication/repair protein RecF [Alphaproteobacteria bacterium]|nr:DNA replication/repair protein RecF [Alphaproteobacteria bacterium]